MTDTDDFDWTPSAWDRLQRQRTLEAEARRRGWRRNASAAMLILLATISWMILKT